MVSELQEHIYNYLKICSIKCFIWHSTCTFHVARGGGGAFKGSLVGNWS